MRKAKNAPAGRPTKFNQDLADLICERLAMGESMRSVSRDESMPCMSTLFKWLREIESFSQQYAQAKEESADAMSEDALDIADNVVGNPVIVDGVHVTDANGVPLYSIDSASVQHAKLKVDTRKWLMSKMKPKKYGEKVTNEHSGPGGGPIDHSVSINFIPVKRDKSD